MSPEVAERAKIPTGVQTPAGFKDLRIFHLSLEVFDSTAQAAADVAKVGKLRPHLLGGTEAGEAEVKEMLRDVLGPKYYVFTASGGGDAWGAVRRSLVHSDIERTYKQIIASGKAMKDPHHYAAKGVLSIGWENNQLGPMGFVPGGHYLTKGRWKGQAQQDKPGDPVDHIAQNLKLAGAMADETLRLARGKGLAWMTADTNLVLRQQAEKAVAGRPLTVCWDEVKHYPNTGHGNIDGVFSCDSDGRTRCIQADALEDRDFFLNTDHFLVRTTYRTRKLAA